jgi:RimJ/RimL family protein N-acetyltransferase
LLEGKNVNLKIMEKDEVPIFVEWANKSEFFGKYNPLVQMSKLEVEKMFEDSSNFKLFFVEKKNGTKIGFMCHFHVLHLGTGSKQLEIGYSLIPSERGKGYCSEAVKIMVDYLFLSKEIMRIQAQTDQRNTASQKVLEKAGFKREGTLRKNFFIRGEWTDDYIYSILREEWKEPKILTRTA